MRTGSRTPRGAERRSHTSKRDLVVICSDSGTFPGSAASSSSTSLGAGQAGSDLGEPRPGGRWDRAEPVGQVERPELSLELPLDVAVGNHSPSSLSRHVWDQHKVWAHLNSLFLELPLMAERGLVCAARWQGKH